MAGFLPHLSLTIALVVSKVFCHVIELNKAGTKQKLNPRCILSLK